ncbi:hypothetical protein VTN00DRAFT_4347 [Thermoascus crustaceus]|uniref:uncharacterized protein n=1 Tax=Thermoascus crustaceus TaxID=5088 RepID=UPI00374487D2
MQAEHRRLGIRAEQSSEVPKEEQDELSQPRGRRGSREKQARNCGIEQGRGGGLRPPVLRWIRRAVIGRRAERSGAGLSVGPALSQPWRCATRDGACLRANRIGDRCLALNCMQRRRAVAASGRRREPTARPVQSLRLALRRPPPPPTYNSSHSYSLTFSGLRLPSPSAHHPPSSSPPTPPATIACL